MKVKKRLVLGGLISFAGLLVVALLALWLLAYSLAGTAVIVFASRKLVALNYDQLRLEAEGLTDRDLERRRGPDPGARLGLERPF